MTTANNNSFTVTEDNVRIIDIFIVPNGLSVHHDTYEYSFMDITAADNELAARLGLTNNWKAVTGDLAVQIVAMGFPHDCAKPDMYSNITDHGLDAELRQRIADVLPDGIVPATRFMNRLPVRMLEDVQEGDILELIPGVLSARFVQLPYRYSRFGNFQTVLQERKNAYYQRNAA